MTTLLELLASNILLAGVLALLVWGVTRIWRNPHLAHGLWFLVLLKLVTPPLISAPFPIALPQTEEVGAVAPERIEDAPGGVEATVEGEWNVLLPLSEPENEVGPVAVVPAAVAKEEVSSSEVAATTAPFPWLEVAGAAWLTGMVILLLMAVSRCRRLRAVIAEAREADQSLSSMAQAISERIGLARCPRVGVVAGRIPPFVTLPGPGQMVVLPEQLLEELEPAQVESVLAHEFAHLRRRDHWVRAFELVVLWFFWWNPVAWMASRRLRQAAEDCCDAYVIWALPGGRRSYGSALLRTVEFLTEGPRPRLLAANTMGPPLFKHRIETIMKKNTPHRTTGPTRALVLGLGLVALPFAMTALSDGHPHPEDATKPAPKSDVTSVVEVARPSTSDQKVESVPFLGDVPVVGTLFRAEGTDMDVIEAIPRQRKTAYEIFEYKAKGEQAHQLARVMRKNLQVSPNQSYQEAAKMAEKLGIPVRSVRRHTKVEGHASEAVLKAAKNLKVGEISEVIHDGESCYIVRRTVTEARPEGGRTIRRFQKVKVGDVNADGDPDIVIESVPATEAPNILRARLTRPAGGGTGGVRTKPAQTSSEAEYKAHLTLLNLDVEEAKVHHEALVELEDAFVPDSTEARDNRLQTKLAKIRIERAKAAIELFKAQNPRGGKPRPF